MGFWSGSNPRSRAVVLLATGASALVAIGLFMAVARPAARSSSPTPTANERPTSPPKPQQNTVPLDVIAHLSIGPNEATAMTVSPGVVWLATQGTTGGAAGTLIRVDATTAHKTATWSVGGDPVAVAAGGDFVWVANGVGDGAATPAMQSTVEQFDAASGALVNVYRVQDPRGLVANPDSALVISSEPGQHTAISLLAGGHAQLVTTLAGTLNVPLSSLSPEVAVAVCAGQAFVALTSVLPSSSNVAIYALPPSGGPVRTVATIPNDYEASMACDVDSLFVIGAAGNGDVSVARVSIATGTVTNLWEGPYPVAVASMTGRIWIAYSDDSLDQSFLTSLDPVTGLAAAARSVLPPPPSSGDPNLLVPGDSGLWLVASLGNELLHIATN
jgi:hypothetical protein